MDEGFAAWIQQQLEQRSLQQTDVIRAARQRGYVLDSGSFSRIMTREKEAGLTAVIALAHGLGVTREESFRARGWLLDEPERLVDPERDDPRLVALVREIRQLPEEQRKAMLDVWEATLRVAVKGRRREAEGAYLRFRVVQ